MKRISLHLLITTILSTSLINPALAGLQPFLGEVMPVAFNACPTGSHDADGSLLPIATNTALFALIGTTYGGDGITNFALPDLRGRVPIGKGTGAGLTQKTLGQKGGSENFILTTAQIPSHTHTVKVMQGRGTITDPDGHYFAESGIYRMGSTANKTLNPITVETAGKGNQITKQSPYQTIRYCVFTTGVFPS